MGKYSLENYEKYKAFKLRPPVDNSRDGNVFARDTAIFSNIEPSKGDFAFKASLKANRKNLLQPCLDIPEWAKADEKYACAFIKELGYATNGASEYDGVIIDLGEYTSIAAKNILDAYKSAFDNSFLLVNISDTTATNLLKGTNHGIYIADKIMSSREKMAEFELHRKWENSPLYIECQNDDNIKDKLNFAASLHAYATDIESDLGSHISLRKLSFPRELSVGGAAPMRFWWQNDGTSPEYRHLEICVAIKVNDKKIMLDIDDKRDVWHLGDSTYNKIVQLPNVGVGSYDLYFGVFDSKGNGIKLYNKLECEDGFYKVGTMNIDAKARPQLFDAWNNYYPEGYYPLEDPKQPEEK